MVLIFLTCTQKIMSHKDKPKEISMIYGILLESPAGDKASEADVSRFKKRLEGAKDSIASGFGGFVSCEVREVTPVRKWELSGVFITGESEEAVLSAAKDYFLLTGPPEYLRTNFGLDSIQEIMPKGSGLYSKGFLARKLGTYVFH